MSILQKIKDALSGPPRIDYGHGAEGAEAMDAISEELPVAASDEAELERSQAPESLGRAQNLAGGASAAGSYEPHPDVGALAEAEADAEAADDAADKS